MAEETTFTFCSLAGIEPGITTLNDVRHRFGDPESESTTKPSKVFADDPGGDLIWHFESRGVKIFVHRDDVTSPNPPVDEVHVSAPFDEILPCGLHIGQSLESARHLIGEQFVITNEYEDAIDFVASTSKHLLATIENWETDKVVSLLLFLSESARDV